MSFQWGWHGEPLTAKESNAWLATSYEAVAFFIGIGLHQLVFRFGEWDTQSFRILSAFTSAWLLLGLIIDRFDGHPLSTALSNAASLESFAVLGIWSSMLVYRGFFHHLHRFPGPFLARLSTLYMTAINIRERKNFRVLQALHKRYGDYVRVGPRELSITDPKAFPLIYSATKPLQKGPWYAFGHPLYSVHTERDPKLHNERRKAWDKAFSAAALRQYEERLATHASELLAKIDDVALPKAIAQPDSVPGVLNTSDSPADSTPVNITTLLNYFAWDVMGSFAFGHSFNMLRSTKPHYFFRITRVNMVLIAGFSRLIWLFPIFKALPLLNFQYNAFRRWIDAFVLNRKENPPDVLDVFAPILEEYEKKPKGEQNFDDLIADASTTVVAGSDTTAGTLTCLFYLLARHPEEYRKLQTELDQLTSSIGHNPDNQDLAKLPYLQACIEECLRLFHPIPSGMQRVTPAEGLTVDSTFIPGDTLVQMPWHILHRDPRCFARPDEFIPERWTTRRQELVLAASVFQPFGVGRHSCVGKQLGLMEVRRVVALVASQYDLQLATGVEDFEGGLEDLFTFEMPKLELVFSHRQ